jgi:autotransporter-associated beta strand protein
MKLRTLPHFSLGILLVTHGLQAADITITGASAINGMNSDYTVSSPDALILDVTGLGGSRVTDAMGAAIAKSGRNLTISGNGTLRITGGSGDVLGIADVSGRTVNISLSSGGLIDIQGGSFVNGGWGGGNWSANLADMNIASGAIFDIWDGGVIRVDALTGGGAFQNGSNSSGMRSLVLGVDGGTGTFSGVIGGGTGRAGENQISLTKEGVGTQIVTGNNTYAGATTVSGGKLQIGNGGTAGTLGSGNVTIESGATLEINRSDNYATVGGQTFSGAGTLVKNGGGNLTLNGTGQNQPLASGLQNLVVNGGTVRTDNWGQWKSDLNLTVNGAGVFEMWNTTTSLGNLSGDGTVRNSANWSGYANGGAYASNNLTIAAGNFAGIITDNGIGDGGITGTGGDTRINLLKTSSGTLTLSGNNSYKGTTTVAAGTLIINGNISTSSLTTVASGATIGGSGTVGALTISSGGFVNPGNSPGILNTGNYIQAGTLVAEITGLTAGTQHDQVNVTGTVTLSGALSILATGGTYAANNIIFLILNDDIDAVNGTFSGLAQGATAATFGGFDWIISYEANSTGSSFLGGNDVALRAIPEPSATLLGGLGALALLRRRRK